jgi:hypothetical protein
MNKMLVGILCLVLSGCLVQTAETSEGRDNSSTPTEQSEGPGPDQEAPLEPNPCGSTIEILKLPNGEQAIAEIPIECNIFYIDRGDPPPESQQHHTGDPEIQINVTGYSK